MSGQGYHTSSSMFPAKRIWRALGSGNIYSARLESRSLRTRSGDARLEVNRVLDSTKTSQRDVKGVRQVLEKKQGLFRMKMMGPARANRRVRSWQGLPQDLRVES